MQEKSLSKWKPLEDSSFFVFFSILIDIYAYLVLKFCFCSFSRLPATAAARTGRLPPERGTSEGRAIPVRAAAVAGSREKILCRTTYEVRV